MTGPNDAGDVLEVFPDSARIVGADLTIGDVAAADARGGVRHAARRLLREHAAGAGAGAARGARTVATSRSGRRRSPTSPFSASCARRASAPTSPRPASSSSPAPPDSAATRSSCTATTRARRSSAMRPPKARRSSSTHPTRRSWRPRPACSACSCASRSASTPTPTRRSAPGTTARSSASLRHRRAR